MKTKRIKIIAICIILFVVIVALTSVILSLNTISHSMTFNKPSRIVVYYNRENGNQVYEPETEQYNAIYSSIVDSYNQNALQALVTNSLNKKVKVEAINSASIDYSGIVVRFVYDTPQVVKYKNNNYINNNDNYWYQNLVFNINSQDKFAYNSVAIIPPMSSKDYLGEKNYSLQYQVYSNFNNAYKNLIKLFK